MKLFCISRMRMGVKESMTVWARKIFFPLLETGLNVQRPLETKATVENPEVHVKS
jgi:hypothetical protein